ncbi:acyltransferase family protein [Kineococcus rubinsiae]|uniref:acyltransferase family protein n=1 Tax=Kineococcus rubinsiae TaxID=2609562 RepID=UPI001430E4A8|nr:acyltransferase [Kineococcus rubinsiae]NIZ91720.1 acyltransferase [Kineococcus rubinsiae]
MTQSKPTPAHLRTDTGLAKPSAGFRGDIEGLRAVAIGLVLLFNAQVPFFDGGYIGVDVFFVISGFLITGLLVKEVERTGTLSLTDFYARRARRILPSATFVLVVTLLVCAVVLPEERTQAIARDGLASVLQVANWWFLSFDTSTLAPQIADSPLRHYWSLAVEEQFYLVWPLTVLLVAAHARRRGKDVRQALVVTIVVICLASWALHAVLSQLAFQAAFFAGPTRAWQLGTGAFLALSGPHLIRWLQRHLQAHTAWVLATSGAALLLASPLWSSRWGLSVTATLATVATALIIVAGGVNGPTTAVARLLSTSPVRYLGRLSYVWYLWHVPFVMAAEGLGVHTWSLRLAVELLAALPAVATMVLIERPCRLSPRLRSTRNGLLLGAATTAVGGGVALALMW